MKFWIKHSLPGRVRVRYDKSQVTSRQAALAAELLSTQDGIKSASVNCVVGSFLICYDDSVLSEKHIQALFMALSEKYLQNQELLDAVEEPQEKESLLFNLAVMTAEHYAKAFLPFYIRLLLRVVSLCPRIARGLLRVAEGQVFHSEVLDSAAIAASLLAGDAGTASNINFLLNVGDAIEEFTKKKSYGDLADRLLSKNDKVQLVEVGADNKRVEKSVPLSLVKKGDLVAVRTGGVIPVDGTVASGEALVNQAAITGEPLAVEKRQGASVFAGTLVQEGEIFVETRAVGSQTKVQGILSMIDSSQQLKVSSQVRSENLANQLVKCNFLLSAATFLFTGSLRKVMATLMVDYSCAMKLAAPIAVLSAMKEAAENGIIVKGGKFLEEASKADTLVFDKTGTLTCASPRLSKIHSFCKKSDDELLALAACLEEHFAHPIAAAIVQAAKERGLLHPEEHAKVEYIVAHGIATSLKGKRLLIGSRHFIFDDENCQAPKELQTVQKSALENGESLLYLAEEKRLIAAFAINDPLRQNAARVIQALRASGITKCAMVTGDDEGAAKNAAASAGVDHYVSRALPEDKVSFIEKEKKNGRKVVMVGDGINDAPALSAADVGIAMGNAADIAGETADISLPADSGLEGLFKVRGLGRALMERIDLNNRDIVAVNTALMFLSLFGAITPSAAALLHNASTVMFGARAMKPFLGTKAARETNGQPKSAGRPGSLGSRMAGEA